MRRQLNEGMLVSCQVERSAAEVHFKPEVIATAAAINQNLAPIPKPDRIQDKALAGGNQQRRVTPDPTSQPSNPQGDASLRSNLGELSYGRLQVFRDVASAQLHGLRAGLYTRQQCQKLEHLVKGLQG